MTMIKGANDNERLHDKIDVSTQPAPAFAINKSARSTTPLPSGDGRGASNAVLTTSSLSMSAQKTMPMKVHTGLMGAAKFLWSNPPPMSSMTAAFYDHARHQQEHKYQKQEPRHSVPWSDLSYYGLGATETPSNCNLSEFYSNHALSVTGRTRAMSNATRY